MVRAIYNRATSASPDRSTPSYPLVNGPQFSQAAPFKRKKNIHPVNDTLGMEPCNKRTKSRGIANRLNDAYEEALR